MVVHGAVGPGVGIAVGEAMGSGVGEAIGENVEFVGETTAMQETVGVPISIGVEGTGVG